MIVRQHLPPKDNRPCICRICECGKHPCPGVAEMAPLNGISSYRDHYPGKQPEPGDRAMPQNRNQLPQSLKAAPGHYMTTNQAAQEAGKGIPIDKAISYKPVPTEGDRNPFAGDTTYHVDYPGHDPNLLGSQRAMRPREALQNLPAVPGAFETTNQAANNAILAAHRDGTFKPTQSAKGADGGALAKAPFSGNTNYREEYIKHPLDYSSPRKGADRDNFGRAPNDNRDFLTTHGAAYQHPPAQTFGKCPACYAPVRPASSDGHIKLLDVPDHFGNMTPAAEFLKKYPRGTRKNM